jgi:hypothetical protein
VHTHGARVPQPPYHGRARHATSSIPAWICGAIIEGKALARVDPQARVANTIKTAEDPRTVIPVQDISDKGVMAGAPASGDATRDGAGVIFEAAAFTAAAHSATMS